MSDDHVISIAPVVDTLGAGDRTPDRACNDVVTEHVLVVHWYNLTVSKFASVLNSEKVRVTEVALPPGGIIHCWPSLFEYASLLIEPVSTFSSRNPG
jgi:hypothetical protein